MILTSEITLSNVFYIPEYKHNLLSVARIFVQHNLVANFKPSACSFQDLSTKVTKDVGIRHVVLYKLLSDVASSSSSVHNHFVSLATYVPVLPSFCSHVKHCDVSFNVFHARHRHMSLTKFQHLSGFVFSKSLSDFDLKLVC